jgi:type III secretory pathway component EscV
MDKFDLKKFLTENKLTRTSVLREGVENDIEQAIKDKKIDPKKVKDAAEKAEKGNDSKDLAVLMATANMMKEAKKKKKKDTPEDEEIDLDLDTETPEGDEDTNISIDDTSAPSSDNPLVSTLQDTLLKALDTAEQLGDDKLTKQIGNTVTMFTRTHISQPDQPINEDEEYTEGSNNRFFTGDDDGPSLDKGEVQDFLESRYIFDDWESLQDSPSTAKKLSKQMDDIELAIKDYLKSDLSHLTVDMTDDEIEDQMSEDLNSYLEY